MKTESLTLFACAAALLLAGNLPAAAAGRRSPGRISPLSYSLRPVTRAPAASTLAAFRKFSAANGGKWKVRYSPSTGRPESMMGAQTSARYSGTPAQASAAFLAANSALLQVDTSTLRVAQSNMNLGMAHVQYQQYYKGLPVEFAYARVHVLDSGRVAGYQARFEPDIDISIVPSITAEQAAVSATSDLGAQLKVSSSTLVIYPDTSAKKLAWRIRGRAAGGLWVYYIDAQTGAVLLAYDDMRRARGYSSCSLATMGTSSATVYDISPLPTQNSDLINVVQSSWEKPVKKSESDQYFWVGDYHNYTPTNAYGDYCTSLTGKVFSTFKGPYFAVANSHGPSANFDNADAVWRTYTHSPWIESSHPYADSSSDPKTGTVVPLLTGVEKLAKVMPRFASFSVGVMDEGGNVSDADEVHIKSPGLTGNNTVGSYIGTRAKPFYGAAVEYPSFIAELDSDVSATADGYKIDQSSYMVLINAPSVTHPVEAAWSVLWSTNTNGNNPYGQFYLDTTYGHTFGLDEPNAFYHLNRMRRYFQAFNKDYYDPAKVPVDLDKRVAVMVHANGDPDALEYRGMQNAFYDLEADNIFFGDGPIEVTDSYYRSLALDGTIIRHEYTHLAVHRIYNIINYGEFGAISEALSDYFSLASFWKEGYDEGNSAKKDLSKLGNFIGPGAMRDISLQDKVLAPTGGSWRGELYNDSAILSQALYTLRNGGSNSLGTMSGGLGTYDGLPTADFVLWSSLFYFPDSFANLYEAMMDVCARVDSTIAPGSCSTGKISAAFAAHGIAGSSSGDAFETTGTSGLCSNNNGPECAADIDFATTLGATIYPAGDEDYYAVPAGAGTIQVTLKLPASTDVGEYKAYAVYLFDAGRNYLSEAVPVINTIHGVCPDTGDCTTLTPSVTLNYTAPSAGRYYVLVAACPTENYSNSSVYSASSYTLSMSYTANGGASASLESGSAADYDRIGFTAYYNAAAMNVAPVSAGLTTAEQVFSYAQLRDHNGQKLALARTDLSLAAGSLLQVIPTTLDLGTDIAGLPIMTGSVRLQNGFAARYPGVGTVQLEVFGVNHMGSVVSLGVSNPINLTSARSALTTYNNVISAPGDKATVKYEVLAGGTLSIKVYTLTGALVKTLIDGAVPAGKGAVDWDGTNDTGGKAASGIYFIKAKGSGLNKVDKIAIVR